MTRSARDSFRVSLFVLIFGIIGIFGLAAGVQASSGPGRSQSPVRFAMPGGAVVDPLSELRQTVSSLTAALQHRYPDWSPEADAMKWRVERQLAGILDYEEIARRAFGNGWDGLNEAQQRQFLNTFSALTNQTFVSALTRPNAHLRFDSETVIGPVASVMVTAWVSRPTRQTEEQIEYQLRRKGNRWVITDVLVGGVSLVDGYPDQIARLMRRGGFAELIARMEQKLNRERRD